MKMRIKGNSVRLRLSKSEVELFAEKGKVEERTEFANSLLVYSLQTADVPALMAAFSEGNLTVWMPAEAGRQWAATSAVSISEYMPLPNGNQLYLLIEKDFKCIDAPKEEDQSDFFDNPAKSC